MASNCIFLPTSLSDCIEYGYSHTAFYLHRPSWRRWWCLCLTVQSQMCGCVCGACGYVLRSSSMLLMRRTADLWVIDSKRKTHTVSCLLSARQTKHEETDNRLNKTSVTVTGPSMRKSIISSSPEFRFQAFSRVRDCIYHSIKHNKILTFCVQDPDRFIHDP